ncbi:MAG: hypothetical protein ACR2KB_06005 [Chitinophagaceae bacterium]
MKHLILFLLLSILFNNSFAQNEFPEKIYFKLKKEKYYSATINNKESGYIIQMNDSSILTTSKKYSFGHLEQGNVTPYSEIDLLILRQDGGRGRSALLGSLIGIAAGGLIGAASYNKPKSVPCTSQFCINGSFMDFGVGGSMLLGSFLGGVAGAGLGAILGPSKHKYHLKRKKENFEKMNFYLSRN